VDTLIYRRTEDELVYVQQEERVEYDRKEVEYTRRET
jgi:hypothetical protein